MKWKPSNIKKHSWFLLYRTLQQIVAWLSAEPGTKQSLRAYSNKYKKPTWLTNQATKQQLRVDYQAQEEGYRSKEQDRTKTTKQLLRVDYQAQEKGYSSMEQDQTKTHYDWV